MPQQLPSVCGRANTGIMSHFNRNVLWKLTFVSVPLALQADCSASPNRFALLAVGGFLVDAACEDPW